MIEVLATPNFKRNVAAAVALVTLLLTVGMIFAIEGFDGVAAAQITHIRAEEQEITLAERLRWSGELIVSAGRGYLISGDPALLRRLLRARADFEDELQALSAEGMTSGAGQLLAAVRQDATSFVRSQEALTDARTDDIDNRELTLRFERELIPMQRALGKSLDRFVENKESELNDIYMRAAAERGRLQALLYCFLAGALALAFMTTVHFARLVETAFRKEREAVDTARRAVISRDEFMGVVAHDLRTPLQAIILRALLLKKQASSPQLLDQASSITRIAHTMEHLIRTMLDVASIQARRFSITPEACGAHQLVSECFAMLEPVAHERGVRLSQHLANDELSVHADRERVLQVLTNLIGNAIKFAPPQTAVSLTVREDGTHVRFEVADQGPGIAAAEVPRLFDRFWRRHGETKTGTGLGLFIAKSIVEAHSGRIWVESKSGLGATFCFTLPRAERAVPHYPLPASKRNASQTGSAIGNAGNTRDIE